MIRRIFNNPSPWCMHAYICKPISAPSRASIVRNSKSHKHSSVQACLGERFKPHKRVVYIPYTVYPYPQNPSPSKPPGIFGFFFFRYHTAPWLSCTVFFALNRKEKVGLVTLSNRQIYTHTYTHSLPPNPPYSSNGKTKP